MQFSNLGDPMSLRQKKAEDVANVKAQRLIPSIAPQRAFQNTYGAHWVGCPFLLWRVSLEGHRPCSLLGTTATHCQSPAWSGCRCRPFHKLCRTHCYRPVDLNFIPLTLPRTTGNLGPLTLEKDTERKAVVSFSHQVDVSVLVLHLELECCAWGSVLLPFFSPHFTKPFLHPQLPLPNFLWVQDLPTACWKLGLQDRGEQTHACFPQAI